MTCCYLRVDQLYPDTFIISYLMLNRSIFIIIWDGSPPDSSVCMHLWPLIVTS